MLKCTTEILDKLQYAVFRHRKILFFNNLFIITYIFLRTNYSHVLKSIYRLHHQLISHI